MKLTVLGKSPAWQDPGGANSGYLLENDNIKILLDAGNGVTANLQKYIYPAQLDAIIISHLHADHFFDLVPLAYLLKFLPAPYGQPSKRPVLYLPSGGENALKQICSIWQYPQLMEEIFIVKEYDADQQLEIGMIKIDNCLVPHYVQTHAFAFYEDDYKKLTYGADCGFNNNLIELARKSNCLIAEATLPEKDLRQTGHMAAEEAADLALEADVQKLMLTHYSYLLADKELIEKAKNFQGQLLLAKEHQQLEL